jgi:lysophospholipase L1-like esterase
MPMSRRTLFRAGASGGFALLLGACGDGGVRAAGSDRNRVIGSLPSGSEAIPTRPSVAAVPTKLAMVGDSITKASSEPLTTVLTQQGFTDITIDAEVSRRIAVGDGKGEPLSGVKTLYTMIAKGVSPDVWVIAMGTNDAGKYGDDEYATLIDQMMTMPNKKTPLVWVDVYNPNELAGTKRFNLVLRDRARARGNTTVVPWFDVASDPKGKILRKDHVHPNDNGTLVFADLVAKALN